MWVIYIILNHYSGLINDARNQILRFQLLGPLLTSHINQKLKDHIHFLEMIVVLGDE